MKKDDDLIPLELAARIASFAKLTGRSFREAFQYLLRRGQEPQKRQIVFISHHHTDANAIRHKWICWAIKANENGWTLVWRD